MKKFTLQFILWIFICTNASAQNTTDSAVTQVSKSFFFDSIVPQWVAPKPGYFTEEIKKEWSVYQGKYIYVKKQIWTPEVPGHYKNVSKLFLNDNGKITYASEEVLANELKKDISTSKPYAVTERKNKTFGFGATLFLSGLVMIGTPIGMQVERLLVNDAYFISSIGLMAVGTALLIVSNRNKDYYKDKAVKQYNANNGITKKWQFKPNVSMLSGKINSSFQFVLKF